ncbi:serine hydrolase domain-containing protein [candidate division KSB1 bacterium]
MNKISRVLLSHFLLLFLLIPSVSGQGLPKASPEELGLSPDRLERISIYMQDCVDKQLIPGVVTLVARHGKVAYLESFGMMDIETGTPMTNDAIFRICSMTKTITSVAIMMLYEEGHFLLTDPISKYIPEFNEPKVLVEISPGTSELVAANREITIQDLLTHTSGLTYKFMGIEPFAELYEKAGIKDGLSSNTETIGEMVEKLAKLPLMHHPGEAWNYSLSVDVLGRLIEVVSDKTLEDYFHEYIFKPLNMQDTYFYLPEEKVPRLASVYFPNKQGGLDKIDDMQVEYPSIFVTSERVESGHLEFSTTYPYSTSRSYFSGGGGLSSTISDYSSFLQMLLNGGALDGTRLLGRKTVEFMKTNHTGDLKVGFGPDGYNFGLGFMIHSDPGSSGQIGSKGDYGWSGFFYTWFVVDPVEDMTFIMMTQMFPCFHLDIHEKFRVLAYQSIVDK